MQPANMPPFDRDITEDEEFTFYVKAEDIGNRCDPEHCVFARCAKMTLRTKEAWFGLTVGYARIDGKIVRFAYRAKLGAAIHGYDAGKPIPPGVYKVRRPPPSMRREGKAIRNRRRANRDGSRPETGVRRVWHAPRGWGRGRETAEVA